MPVVLKNGLSVKAKAQNMCHKKNMLQKSLETKKKNLRRGLNPQLSWLITVCLRGFDRNVSQKMTGVPCLPSTPVLSISNQHIRVPESVRLISLKSRFDACLESQVTKLDFKKRDINFRKKNLVTSWIRTHNFLNASQLL